MFSMEFKVNGNMTFYIHGNNIKQGEPSFYEWALYDCRSSKAVNGMVTHSYQDGLLKLVELVIKAAEEKRNEP